MLKKGRTWKEKAVTVTVFILSCLIAASIAQSSGREASVGSNVAQNGQNFGFGSGFVRPETASVIRNTRQGASQGGNAPFLSSFLQKFQNFLNRVTDLTATLNRRRENLNNAYNFNPMPTSIPAMLQNIAPNQQNAPLLNNPSTLTLETDSGTKNKSTVNRRFQRQNKSFNDDDDSDLPPIITSDEEEDDGPTQALTAGSTGGSAQSAISQSVQVGGKNMMDLLLAVKTQAELKKVQEAAKEPQGNVVINDQDDDEDTRDFAPFPSFDDDEEAGGGFDAEVEIPNIKNQKNAAASTSPPPQTTSSTTSSTTTSPSRPPINDVTSSAEGERNLEDLAPTFSEEDEDEDDTSATGVQPPPNQPILFQSTPAPSTTRATTTTTTRRTTATTTTTAQPTTRTTPRTTTTTASSVASLVDLAEDYDKEIDEPPPPVITTRRPTTTTLRTTIRPPAPTILRSTTTAKPVLPPAADLIQNIVPASPSFPKQNNRPNPPQSYTTRLNQRPQQTTPQYSNDGLRYPNANSQSFNQGPSLLQFLNPSEPSPLQPQFNQDQGFPQRNSQTPPISLDNIAELIRNHLLQNLYSAVQSTTGNLFRTGGQPGQSSPTIIHIGPININTGSNGRLNYGTTDSGEHPGLQPFTNGEVAADRTGPRKAKTDTNLSTPGGPFQPSTKSTTNILPTKPLTSIQSSEITDQFDLPPTPNDQTSSSFGSSSNSFQFDGPPPPLPGSDDFGALQDFPPSPVQTASRGFNAQQDGPQQPFLGEPSYPTDEDNDREKIVTNSGPPVPVIPDYDDADEIDLRIMKKG